MYRNIDIKVCEKEGYKVLFRNYAKPGKGVNKRDPNQPRYQIFFEILPRNLWRLVKLSILYLLVALPFLQLQ